MTIDANMLQDLLSYIGTALVTAITVMLALRRRASRDSAEMTKDRAEESVIKHLEAQRDRATLERDEYFERLKRSEAEKHQAIQKMMELTSEVHDLSGQVKILKELVKRLGDTLDQTKIELQVYIRENAVLVEKVKILEGKSDARSS